MGRVSSYPSPFVGEKMPRQSSRREMHEFSSPSDQASEPPKKKRKVKCRSHGKAVAESFPFMPTGTEAKNVDFLLADDSIRTFITTWKETCRRHTAAEVFERMLEYYNFTKGKRKKLRKAFSKYPLVGLLNVAVTSLKQGMWDSMYDTFQSMGELGQENAQDDEFMECMTIDVQPIEKDHGFFQKGSSGPTPCVSAEDIVKKASQYLAENIVSSSGTSLLHRILVFAKQLSCCEGWLAEKFAVSDFQLLGHGNFLSLLERNSHLFPEELLKDFSVGVQKHQQFEVSMIQKQLVMLVSQASSSVWEDNAVSKEKISELLRRQFPLISFKASKDGSIEQLLDSVRQHSSSFTSSSVIYSATLLDTSSDANCARVNKSNPSELMDDIDRIGCEIGPVTSRDVLEVLLRAPFLSDLISWSHWDTIYAPSLGPLVEWLLTEVNVKGLLCLLTRDGKIIRIDHSSSGDLFLQALIQESPFQAAVQLVSLFAVSGGTRHVPLSLLKCQAHQGFEVVMANSMDTVELGDGQRSEKVFRELAVNGGDSSVNLVKNLSGVNKTVARVSRIVIDCLTFLPSEFRCFAADVLLSGLRSLVKDIASAMLLQSQGAEERLMLHEVGFALGIVEWISDHHSLCPITDINISTAAAASSCMSVGLDLEVLGCTQFPSNAASLSATSIDGQCGNSIDASSTLNGLEVDGSENVNVHQIAVQNFSDEEAALVIESIRREEFGLNPNISDIESSMLKKQHARLGRALCCLSQELYSQDSHFLLELVQNADDNIYSENIEPTLSFIIQDTRIIVLNNESGFTANNIRALCDIGNSTKKGSSAGYIGQKGLGFKSVFRVTDAPEIHSNGYHIKFDICEGQIGFVLPTNVPPCDMDMFKRLATGDDIHKGINCWNTCIVLPFKSKLLESAMSGILSMFSDLHPSLLLFLHRLQSIKLRNTLNGNDSHIVMRKEILGDGIVRVSCGKENMTWFVASNKLHPMVNRSNVNMTEISIAFTLKETLNGGYEPLIGQPPVFAFLPLRTYGLKFILQADFVLPSSREEVDKDSPWNQWLLSEFPGLVVSAEKLFCSLPCFQEEPAKAVSIYMSFIPLVGEVHGFFAGLPRMIISKLRQSNCLLLNGYKDRWVAPCKVLRGWNEQAQMLLPENLLAEHLGLRLLHRDIHLSDALASALGIKEYGLTTLVRFMTSLGCIRDGIKSMGLGWLFSYLNELDSLLQSHAVNLRISELEQDLINSLKKVQFIPLSNGTFGSLDEGTIWLHADYVRDGAGGELGYEVFPYLYATLRIVSPALFSEASGDVNLLNNCSRMLRKIGVEQMSAHELIKIHILPYISDDTSTDKDQQLMTEYITFVMLHLQSTCVDCHVENNHIISELRTKALILTNYGYKRPFEVPIHFGREFGNPVNVNKITHGLDYKWHEVDMVYLKHPITESMSCGLVKWREFLQKLGVTDFVKVVVAEKSITDLSLDVLNHIICDRHLISPGLVVKDWESPELVHILSLLSKNGSQEKCKYLLEVLDALWDDNFSDKVLGHCMRHSSPNDLFFKSSLLRCVSDFKWVVSSVDNELHYPGELFHDCEAVRSILGPHAPYAIPKIQSIKLLGEIGFKTQATLDDVLSILQTWRMLKSPFSASLSQMTKLYTFIWKSMATSRQQVLEALRSGPFIFDPCASVKLHEDTVTGMFLSPAEVYWLDSTGSLDQRMDVGVSVEASSIPFSNTLCSIYPGLHDFFVNEAPSFHHYVQILHQLSRNTLTLQAANMVFQVLLSWSDGLNSGALSPDDLAHLRKRLLQLEFTVLPAIQDKWVSLHPYFGLVCWCDDDSLKKEFKNSDNIEFLYFGELNNNEKEMLHTKVSALLQKLGIPSLSGVVSREAIYYGRVNNGSETSVVEWVLPFAQRYLYCLHPEKYGQLKLSGFSVLHDLRVVVVEKLFYRNVIKRCDCVGKKQSECSSLLQGNILYTTRESDSHTMFMELSRLFFDGTPELHLANFLHMISTMARSGSSEEQTEFFILNSQKMGRLPSEEPVWSLSSPLSSPENEESLLGNAIPTNTNEQTSSKSKKRRAASNRRPVDLKAAPLYSNAREKRSRTQAVITDGSSNLGTSGGISEGMVVQEKADMILTEINDHVVIEDDGIIGPDSTIFPLSGYQIDDTYDLPESSMEALTDPTNMNVESFCSEVGQLKSNGKDQLLSGTFGAHQGVLTGRQGERVAFRYFAGKAGGTLVKWVNQEKETGLPYDIVIGEDEQTREYIEVKASRYATKDWFEISTREWQFAAEKGDSFSIAHVLLSGQNFARITVYKNLVKLCQLRKLRLAVMKPRSYEEPCAPVSHLRRYTDNPPPVVLPEVTKIDKNLTHEEPPVRILDTKTRNTRNKKVKLVKVLWTNHKIEEATWEAEDDMRKRYPLAF